MRYFQRRLAARSEALQPDGNRRYITSAGRWQAAPPEMKASCLKILQAARSLAADKAPGPDGVPVEDFRHFPGLEDLTAGLFPGI